MKALFFFLVATVIYVQCNGQFTDMCLPQPMREVPITLQIKNAPADLSACGGNGLLAIPELEALAEEQIVNRYQQTSGCRLVSLNHTSCKTKGRRGQRVLLNYMANLTCGDESCYHLGLQDRKNRNAIKFYSNHAKHLRDAYRIRSHSDFTYNNMRVEIIYFGGQKGDFHFNCSSNMIEDGVRENIPACGCPSSCVDPCELPPEAGRCRAYFPRYYHNATSRQCERFIYGGCEGNQNRFESQDECETACNVCPEGMVYKECGTSCPSTCDNKDDLSVCTQQCVQGCFCKEGTVLLEEDGEVCVAPEKCPVTKPECPKGMVYRECGTACPDTCDNKDDKFRICTLQCVQGCFCNESTVLLEEDGEVCVAPEKCPVTEPECPEGMVYRECGTACPATCDNKDDEIRICTKQCVPGCFCNESTVLLEEDGEVCVAPEECPVTGSGQECPEGMVYKECGCPTTCADNKDEVPSCTTPQCESGCFCKEGTVLLEAGGEKCVEEFECPIIAN